MLPEVLDYSAGVPGAQAIRDRGYVGAVRYIGFPHRLKCTSRTELESFVAAGIGMALVFEDATGDWKTGEAGGWISGDLARRHSRAIGFPDTRPIYMAIDQDLVQPNDFEIMIRYLRGANKALGGPRGTGVYGEADVIARARDAGVAEWFWQSTAWSKGRREHAHLFQRRETVVINTIDCDVNEVMEADWGQHPMREAAMLSETEYAEITKRVIAGIKEQVLAGDWRFKDNRNPIDMLLQAVDTGLKNEEKLELLLSSIEGVHDDTQDILARPAVSVDAAAVAAALREEGVRGVTEVEVETAMRNVLRAGTDG